MLMQALVQFQEFTTISVENHKRSGKKNILIYLMCLNFILYVLPNKCFAIDKIDFTSLQRLINSKNHCGITYSPSKKAAVINPTCGSAVYINFATKHIYPIINNWPNIAQEWMSETVARVTGPCGTGCAKAVIFVAPATVVSCATHEYRITSLDPHEPPDYYNNRPLLIDTKKGIYVCYDDENNIQVLPLPQYSTIHPPKGYFAEKAEIRSDKLVITYKNKHEKIKRITYSKV